MTVHFENLARVFRCYAPGESFEDGSEPIAIGVVSRRDSGQVEIMATMGQLTRADLRELIAKLGEDGITTIRIKRQRGRHVPYGRLVEPGPLFDIYELSPADMEAHL